MSQDLPPTGGYGPIQYRRNLPPRGFRPSFYVFATLAICSWGFYRVIDGNQEKRELLREKRWARIHLTPVMQAEEDRDMVRRVWAGERREELLMQDVKDWKFGSVYNSNRFVRPTFVPTPSQITAGRPPHVVREADGSQE
ncbi:hypothetical protein TWF481_007188 [Arthrobotrys musiformis]|uniref:NADH dehydrogenase [ubiquinone] 1 alpha subcomplex subunit 13 n=1 Tax=Arthrobotrys musiformis TaxID=47236 RepID=A0AAV9WAQ8_9PEZI